MSLLKAMGKCLIVCVLLMLGQPLLAQTNTSDTDLPADSSSEVATQSPADKAPEKKPEQKKTEPVGKAKPKDKVFKPSEEISEDSPVPFPVDI